MNGKLLTLGLLSAAVAANAQSLVKADTQNPVNGLAKTTRVQTSTAKLADKAMVVSAAQAVKRSNVKRASSDSFYALYDLPEGTLYYGGLSSRGWYQVNEAYLPALKDVTFKNYSRFDTNTEATFDWNVKGYTVEFTQEEDSKRPNATASFWGYYYMPTLTLTQGAQKDSYTMPLNSSDDEENSAGYLVAGCDSVMELSNASFGLGVYGGFTSGLGFTSKENFYDTGKKAVGFAETYDGAADYTYVESVYMLGSVADENGTLNTTSALDGKTLTATICTVGEDGSLKEYAKATATDEDVVPVGDQGMFYVNYKFKETDPILGEVDASISLPTEQFVVVLDGYDQLSTSYTASFASANGFQGNGYALLEDGTLATIGYSNVPDVPQTNLHIGFFGAIPVAVPYVEEALPFPAEGGKLAYSVTTSEGTQNLDYAAAITMLESWEVTEKPDWVSSVDIDASNIEQGGNILAISPVAEALPADVKGRSGKIVLTGNFNKPLEINVMQGEVESGINDVKADSKNVNGAIYNLNGQKVSEATKGILIQNGKKFINK